MSNWVVTHHLLKEPIRVSAPDPLAAFCSAGFTVWKERDFETAHAAVLQNDKRLQEWEENG